MSPVFGHGRLRLYLLRLLDESPRHGYDVIRMLEDRFLGVYAPSAGTVYPRLARLEEEGLVTHDREGGRKVYRLTDAGRAELNARMDELSDLEREIEHSVRDIAREVREDVRDSVRDLREELKHATRDVRGEAGHASHGWEEAWDSARDAWWEAASEAAREAWTGDREAWWRDDKRKARRARREHRDARRDDKTAWRPPWEWEEARETRHGRGRSRDGHREMEELLQRFQESAKGAAEQGHIDEDALRACRTILDDALTALRATLGAGPTDSD